MDFTAAASLRFQRKFGTALTKTELAWLSEVYNKQSQVTGGKYPDVWLSAAETSRLAFIEFILTDPRVSQKILPFILYLDFKYWTTDTRLTLRNVETKISLRICNLSCAELDVRSGSFGALRIINSDIEFFRGTGIRVARSLRFHDCLIRKLNINHADIGHRVEGLRLRLGAFKGGATDAAPDPCLTAIDAKIGESLKLMSSDIANRSSAHGEVKIDRAHITRDVVLDRMCLTGAFPDRGDAARRRVSFSMKRGRVGGKVSFVNVDAQGSIALKGALINGQAIFDGASLQTEFGDTALDISYAQIKQSFYMRPVIDAEEGTRAPTIFGQLRMKHTLIQGNLFMDGARLNNYQKGYENMHGPHGPKIQHFAIWATSMRVLGSVFMRDGFRARSQIRMRFCEIGGDLDMRGALLNTPRPREPHVSDWESNRQRDRFAYRDAFNGSDMRIAGNLFMGLSLDSRHSFRSFGSIRLHGVSVGADAVFSGAIVKQPTATALSMASANIAGHLFLDDGFRADGMTRLRGANIGGMFILDGGRFKSPAFCQNHKGFSNIAIQAIRIHTGGSVTFKNGFRADGAVNLTVSEIGAFLEIEDAEFLAERSYRSLKHGEDRRDAETEALNAPGLKVGDHFTIFGAPTASGGAEANLEISHRVETGRRRTVFVGEVDLAGADVGGYLETRAAKFTRETPLTPNEHEDRFHAQWPLCIALNNARIYRNFEMVDVEADYAFDFGQIEVQGHIYLNNLVMPVDLGVLSNSVDDPPNGSRVAIYAPQTKCGGDFTVGRTSKILGEINLFQSRISGRLRFRHSEFQISAHRSEDHQRRWAIAADEIKVEGHLYFGRRTLEAERGCTVQGPISIRNAEIAGDVGIYQMRHTFKNVSTPPEKDRRSAIAIDDWVNEALFSFAGTRIGGDLNVRGMPIEPTDDQMTREGARGYFGGQIDLDSASIGGRLRISDIVAVPERCDGVNTILCQSLHDIERYYFGITEQASDPAKSKYLHLKALHDRANLWAPSLDGQKNQIDKRPTSASLINARNLATGNGLRIENAILVGTLNFQNARFQGNVSAYAAALIGILEYSKHHSPHSGSSLHKNADMKPLDDANKQIIMPNNHSLNFRHCELNGDFTFSDTLVNGCLDIAGSALNGVFSVRGSIFANVKSNLLHAAFRADSAHITSFVWRPHIVRGTLDLSGASVDQVSITSFLYLAGDGEIADKVDHREPSLVGSIWAAAPTPIPRPKKLIEYLRLTGLRVKSLWPKRRRPIDDSTPLKPSFRLLIDGFSYRYFSARGSDEDDDTNNAPHSFVQRAKSMPRSVAQSQLLQFSRALRNEERSRLAQDVEFNRRKMRFGFRYNLFPDLRDVTHELVRRFDKCRGRLTDQLRRAVDRCVRVLRCKHGALNIAAPKTPYESTFIGSPELSMRRALPTIFVGLVVLPFSRFIFLVTHFGLSIRPLLAGLILYSLFCSHLIALASASCAYSPTHVDRYLPLDRVEIELNTCTLARISKAETAAQLATYERPLEPLRRYPSFSPFWIWIDTLVPVIEIGQEEYWHPKDRTIAGSNTLLDNILRADIEVIAMKNIELFHNLLKIAGWIISALVTIVVVRLTRETHEV